MLFTSSNRDSFTPFTLTIPNPLKNQAFQPHHPKIPQSKPTHQKTSIFPMKSTNSRSPPKYQHKQPNKTTFVDTLIIHKPL